MAMEPRLYPVFKGMQKPLEFMGIRGRFLMFAAAAFGLSFVGFIIFSVFCGKLFGFIAMVVIIGVSLAFIYIKQKEGLHNKKRHRGVFVYKTMKHDS
jgi:hypothetical protein